MVDIATTEPEKLIAGDTWTWEKEISDYPATLWTLKYTLINATNKISITASSDGAKHLVSVAKATTAGYTAGTYKYFAYVESSTERFNVGEGSIIVSPDYTAATTLDTRTHVKKTLDAIEAVIEGRAAKDQEEYTILGRSLKLTPMKDLLLLKDKYTNLYKSELANEKLNKGEIDNSNRILVRF